jgi:coenzyme F420 hydrogenase subunit delta
VQLLEPEDAQPTYCRARVLVVGCGNVLFGDDGFGPAVVAWLDAHWRGHPPAGVGLLDAGTGVRNILLTLALGPSRPERLIVVDAMDLGRSPGELVELGPDELPARAIADLSVHQVPTSTLLKELEALGGVRVRILACQVERVPEVVDPGLSPAVSAAVPRAGGIVLEQVASYA